MERPEPGRSRKWQLVMPGTNSRMIMVLGAAILLFLAGLIATAHILQTETTRYNDLYLDAQATASDRLPLLLALTEIQTDISKVQQFFLESAASHHSGKLSSRFSDARGYAEKFWIDTGTARSHAENLELEVVLESIDAIEMLFPVFYEAGANMARNFNDPDTPVDDELIIRFSMLAETMNSSLDTLPALTEQLTQEKLAASAAYAERSQRRNIALLRSIVILTLLGGLLATLGAVQLYQHLMAQNRQFALERDRAETATLAKSRFLSNVSHELRTPLNAIIGFSEVIKTETFGPVGSVKYREYAQNIHASGQHLLSLVNDILDLSKVEAESEDLYEEEIDVPELAQAAVALVQRHAQHNGVTTDVELLPGTLPKLLADRRKMLQVVVNLLTNGIKFTPNGGKVTLRAWCTSNGHVIEVCDTGIGIAPEDISKIMVPFYQIDNVYSRKHDGSGLGLPLSKRLVELHGGTLELSSKPDHGTTVRIRLPAHRVVSSVERMTADPASQEDACALERAS